MDTEYVTFIDMTEDEMSEAVLDALQWCGHSYDELERMSREGRFDSIQSRHAWMAVEGMRPEQPTPAQ